jgi:hypothetical protein
MTTRYTSRSWAARCLSRRLDPSPRGHHPTHRCRGSRQAPASPATGSTRARRGGMAVIYRATELLRSGRSRPKSGRSRSSGPPCGRLARTSRSRRSGVGGAASRPALRACDRDRLCCRCGTNPRAPATFAPITSTTAMRVSRQHFAGSCSSPETCMACLLAGAARCRQPGGSNRVDVLGFVGRQAARRGARCGWIDPQAALSPAEAPQPRVSAQRGTEPRRPPPTA